MTVNGHQFFHLSPKAFKDVATQSVGKLKPVILAQESPLPFTALDCFDQSLRRSGRLLVESGRKLELWQDGAPVVAQQVSGRPRFVNDFPVGPLRAALSGVSPLRRLLPVGSGQHQRALLALIDDDGKTHCKVQGWQLASSEARETCLVQVQGIRGYGKSLQLVRAHIKDAGGQAVSIDALYTLLFPDVIARNPKLNLAVSADDTAFNAANAIISAGLRAMRENEHGVIADHDTEFLHDYRVQLRKIRSVLSLFKGVYDDQQANELKARFAAMAHPTGPLRDLDVYLMNKQEYRSLLPESLHAGLELLFERIARQRAAERRKIVRHLKSTAYQKEFSALHALFSHPNALIPGPNAELTAHDYACDRIARQYRKVRAAAGAIGHQTPDAQVHELRIHCKKLRYLIEFFSTVLPDAALKKVLKPLKGLQEHLGRFNDYSVQQESLQTFLMKSGRKHSAAGLGIAQSVGALIAVLHSRQLDARDAISSTLVRFNQPAIRQTFNDLVQQGKDAQ